MKVAILTRPEYRSQRFLAEGLGRMLGALGVEARVFRDGLPTLEALARPASSPRAVARRALAVRQVKRWGDYDLFVVSDAMRAFEARLDLGPLRRMARPVLHYEVFYAGGSPYWLERLPAGALEKFDGYLTVSGVHDCVPRAPRPVYTIGLDLAPAQPFWQRHAQAGFAALLDFPRADYAEERAIQERCLARLEIPTLRLAGEYTFAAIEAVYRRAAVYLVTGQEAFGVPIVQLQHYGARILARERWWVRRHCLAPPGSVYHEIHRPKFTENFAFYDDEETLCGLIEQARREHDPATVRERLLAEQPTLCRGDLATLWRALRTFH